ncbi:MAG: hypothetical protein M8354_14260, partial [Halalkalicoccus sp.]|nr:hypothetical protein [Halalkalicoccus sp.]
TASIDSPRRPTRRDSPVSADSPKPRERGGSVVVCPDCELRKAIETPNEAVAFYRRHAAITGHDVDWERADVDGLEAVTPESTDDDPRAVIRTLEGRFPEGVPIGVVTAAASRRGATIGETVDAIRELRMDGELYEPRDDHLRVT